MDIAEHRGLNVIKTNAKKRKIVMEDSDDDLPPSDPIPYKKPSDRSKKARVSAVFSDDEDEEEAPKLNSFAKRLTKYQKSPSKTKARGRHIIISRSCADGI